MHAYSKVIIFLDIEGPPTWPYEIGAIATQRGRIVDSFIGWCPPQFDAESLRQFHSSSRYCHGLRLSWLKSEGESHQALCSRFYCWIMSWKPAKFAASGTCDVNIFLTRLGLTIPVVSATLPIWRDRQHLEEHHEAAAAKQQEILMPNRLCCPYRLAHYPSIKVNSGSFETRKAKMKHGSHCALYDTYEVVLYALSHDLPQL